MDHIPVAYGAPIGVIPMVPQRPARDQDAATTIINNNNGAAITESTYQALTSQGFTRGLAEALVKNRRPLPLAFWVIDNSGSMNTQDGHRLIVDAKRRENVRLVNCTRWAEMQQTVEYHVQMAALLTNPTVFRFLNDPGQDGPQQFSVCYETGANLKHDLAVARSAIRNTRPSGVTPLTDRLNEIRQNVERLERILLANGAKVAIVLATDGMPTDANGDTTAEVQQQFADSLKALELLPVWIVVRLCTDDRAVVEFWNNLDKQLELNLEVLDDFCAEAAEVYKHNKWLNYGLPIHRVRELGFYHHLFDLLDEDRLSKNDLRDFFRLLFGNGNMDSVPDAQEDWKGFLQAITRLVKSEEKQWNPVTKRMSPWIDIARLKKDYGDDSCCNIM